MMRYRRLGDAEKFRERGNILSAPFLQVLDNPHAGRIRQSSKTARASFLGILHSDVISRALHIRLWRSVDSSARHIYQKQNSYRLVSI